jgi:hypothetical protein
MTIKLRAATASQEIALGPFVDEADGVTPLTGLTLSAGDILLHKRGATSLVAKNSGGGTHMSIGVYSAVLDATDTDTVGSLVVFVAEAGALPVRLECEVLPAAVFDALLLGTSPLPVNITHVIGDAVQANSTKETNWGGTP